MCWIYKNEKLEESGCYNVNLLYNVDKFYIMDNHLAAAWCWAQKVDTSKKYGLFHVDRHYDLLNNLGDDYIKSNRDIFVGSDFSAYYLLNNMESGKRAMRYDNYIDTFNRLFPNLIRMVYYSTHKDGSDEKDTSLELIEKYEPNIWDLQSNIKYWILDSNKDIDRWIVNIDIDYFFQEFNGVHYQFLTKKYIKSICRELKLSLSKIDIVTIALSPEFCNGWGNSFNLLRIICDELGVYFPYKYKNQRKASVLLYNKL